MGNWATRAGVLVVIAVAISTGALVSPGDALAFEGPNPATDWSKVRPYLTNATGSSSSLGSNVAVADRTYAARVAVGTRLPAAVALQSVGTIAMYGAALYTGYKIGGTIDRWLGLSTAISGYSGSEASGTAWGDARFASADYCADLSACAGGLPATAGWYLNQNFSSFGNTTVYNEATAPDPPWPARRAAMDALCAGVTGCTASDGIYSSRMYYITAPLPTTVVADVPFTGQTYSGSASGGDVTAMQTAETGLATMTESDPLAEDAMDALLEGDATSDFDVGQAIDPDWDGEVTEFEMPDCDNLTYSACLDLMQDEGYVGTITDTELGIDLADFDFDPGKVVSTNPASGTGLAIGDPVEFFRNPDPMPLEVQAQQANETAQDYVVRMGWGTENFDFVYTELPPGSEDPEAGPDAPVRLKVPKPGGGTRTIPVPHPGQGSSTKRIPIPDPEPADPVTFEIFTNPPNMPDVGETPIPGGPGAGECEPWLTAEFDLSPITDANLGEQFPFGVPEWLLAQINALSAGAEAPVLSVHIASLDMEYGPMDFDVFSPYMSTMRTVLSWLLWFGTIWYVGTSLLGFRGSGNPADAVDDYLGEMF